MKTQPTTRCLLRMMLCVLVLGCRAGADQFFFEDFTDGNAADGSPVNWIPGPSGDVHAGYTLTPEGLQLGGALAADRDGTPYIYRDVSVRVQIKRTSNHTNGEWESGLVCRWNDGGPGGYWIEVRPPNRFWLGHRNRYVLRRATLPFNVDEKELIIRVDMIGDQITCWCWPASEPMPDEPQITLVEDVVPDGTFALYAGTGGGQAVYHWVEAVSMEVPIVDFNGNGTVDMKDLLKLVEAWGQNEPTVDIVPDGVVDKKDLEVLMDQWQQDVNDPTLVAHWALDETEGGYAFDSAGENHGLLIGNPVWRPDGGRVGGALEFDGIGDSVTADVVLSPSAGPFSTLAWIKGGTAGQAVISQVTGLNWLGADPTDGRLMTELSSGGRVAGALCSQAAITDGDWHRIGVTWDGSARSLYVDDVLVAEDAQTGLADCYGGLNIGCGKDMAANTHWTGLIDDVRIYNRAVKP